MSASGFQDSMRRNMAQRPAPLLPEGSTGRSEAVLLAGGDAMEQSQNRKASVQGPDPVPRRPWMHTPDTPDPFRRVLGDKTNAKVEHTTLGSMKLLDMLARGVRDLYHSVPGAITSGHDCCKAPAREASATHRLTKHIPQQP
ncbi:hypothetical protein GN956_G18127 [Arapaima gigas]